MDEQFGGGAERVDDTVERAALRRARNEVATARLLADGVILRSFRSYLQATVHLVSPILLRALAEDGRTLNAAIERLRPAPGWPEALGRPHALRTR